MKKRRKDFLARLTAETNKIYHRVKSLWWDSFDGGNGYIIRNGGPGGCPLYKTQSFDGVVAFMEGVQFALKATREDIFKLEETQKSLETWMAVAKKHEQAADESERARKRWANIAMEGVKKVKENCPNIPSRKLIEEDLSGPMDAFLFGRVNELVLLLLEAVAAGHINLKEDDLMILYGWRAAKTVRPNPTIVDTLRRNVVPIQLCYLLKLEE
jgi:hypothetical protein